MKTKIFTLLVVATMFTTQCLYAYDALINGIAYNLNKTELTAEVTSLNSPNEYSGNITIPSMVNYSSKKYSVTSIEAHAFSNCTRLTSISIPNSIKELGGWTYYNSKFPIFDGCVNLETINNNCIILTANAFIASKYYPCTPIKSIKTINSCASFFDVTEDEWFMCPNTVPNIKITSGELTENAFAVINRNYKTLKTLDIENVDNTELADEAFKGCYNLEILKLPKNLTKIGYMTMADCKKLQEINVPASVTDIDDSAFENCRSMKTLTFGNGSAMKTAEESQLQRIGNWSFYNCHELQNLEIPEGVTEIGLAAFYGCTYLQNLTLPSTLRTIGDNTFAKCEKLAGLRCAAEVPPTIDAKTFEDVDRTIPVTVPQGSLKAYKEDMYWSEFVNLQEETTDAKEIPAEFENIGIVDGTVTYSGNEPFSIHNLNGQDVTNLNGSLNGIHVITIGTASQNMLVK